MGSAARSPSDEVAASLPGSLTDDIPPATSQGSYELHALDSNRRSYSLSSSHTNDEPHEHEVENSAHLASSPNEDMSRAPLLVRSSPAQGTGSYGGVPVLSVPTSPTGSDDCDHVTAQGSTSSKGKGKGSLRRVTSEQCGRCAREHAMDSANRSRHDSTQSAPIHTASRTRRRTARSTIVEDSLEEESLEPRFNSTSVLPIPAGAPGVFQSVHSSSSSLLAGLEEEEETSESEDYPERKQNGQPSDNSPYAQVRASVAATDDITLSINTPRMWALSILFAVLGSSTNLFFSLRYPSVSITPIIALLLVHPLGLLWDQVLKRSDDPDETFVNGTIVPDGEGTSSANGRRASYPYDQGMRAKRSWKQRIRLWLAQGRWNEKEHCCVYISSNVSFGFAFATDVSSIRYLI